MAEEVLVSRRMAALFLIFLFVPFTLAKDKHKPVLPDCVLQAHHSAGDHRSGRRYPLKSPYANNRTAQDEVEKALMRWNGFS